MDLLATYLILAAFALLFVLGACRLSGQSDDTDEQIIRQIADGDGVPHIFNKED